MHSPLTLILVLANPRSKSRSDLGVSLKPDFPTFEKVCIVSNSQFYISFTICTSVQQKKKLFKLFNIQLLSDLLKRFVCFLIDNSIIFFLFLILKSSTVVQQKKTFYTIKNLFNCFCVFVKVTLFFYNF